jgi:hypothetical protein
MTPAAPASHPAGVVFQSTTLPGCGALVEDLSIRQPLEMTHSFPAQLAPATVLSGTITVTNRGAERVTGLAARGPDIWVIQDGRVVATPEGRRLSAEIVDLEPGESMTFQFQYGLKVCKPGEKASDPPAITGRLPAGAYQLVAVHDFMLGAGAVTADDTVQIQGGPWPLTLH